MDSDNNMKGRISLEHICDCLLHILQRHRCSPLCVRWRTFRV